MIRIFRLTNPSILYYDKWLRWPCDIPLSHYHCIVITFDKNTQNGLVWRLFFPCETLNPPQVRNAEQFIKLYVIIKSTLISSKNCVAPNHVVNHTLIHGSLRVRFGGNTCKRHCVQCGIWSTYQLGKHSVVIVLQLIRWSHRLVDNRISIHNRYISFLVII